MPEGILVVDGDTESANRICDVLETVGYEVNRVNDGQEALQIFNPARHGLVFVSQYLPDIGGIELVGEIKSIVPNLSAVIVADAHDPLGAHEAESVGVTGWLFRPVRPDEILRSVTTTFTVKKSASRTTLAVFTDATHQGVGKAL